MHTPGKQSGSVLIISLIILLVLTLIGVSGMRNTTLEEKMVGHLRDKTLAFQAAEAALKRGEQFFTPLVGTGAFDGTGGQYGPADADPDFWATSTWSSTNSFAYTDAILNVATPTALADVASQPRYILKYVGDIAVDTTSLNIGGYGQQKLGNVSDFRITAKGTGGTENSVVILQAYFGKHL